MLDQKHNTARDDDNRYRNMRHSIIEPTNDAKTAAFNSIRQRHCYVSESNSQRNCQNGPNAPCLPTQQH